MFEEIFEAAAAVLRCGHFLGQIYSVGAYKSATEQLVWAVLSRDGAVRLKSDDLYGCAWEFVRLESMVPLGVDKP